MEAEVQRLIKRNYIKQIPPKQNIVSLAPHPFFLYEIGSRISLFSLKRLGIPYAKLAGYEFKGLHLPLKDRTTGMHHHAQETVTAPTVIPPPGRVRLAGYF